MSRILEIAADVFWLAIIIGGGGWLFIHSLKVSEDPAKIILKWLITIPLVIGETFLAHHLIGSLHAGEPEGNLAQALVLTISIAACGVTLATIWGSHIGGVVAKPLTSLFDGGDEPPEPKPLYSIAYSKRKLNKPLEAIVEIRKQLAKFPNDFEGVTLLASIQAEDLKDLPSAEITFNHFCDSENAPSKQVAAAWTQLADWHLKFFQDADSARAALEKIIERFPDTELSLQAAQRVGHLVGTEKQLRAAQNRRPVFIPEGVKSIGLTDSFGQLIPVETHPEKLAAELVKHLALHPDDTEAREKLAVIYADHYQRLDLAALELEQLIEQPNQPAKHVAHWLNLLADLQIRHGADYETARATLQKIVEKFPDFSVAAMAQKRLGLLKLELKGKKETPDVKLGVYEQNIGLKGNRTY